MKLYVLYKQTCDGESEAIRLASLWVKEKYLELDFGITHGST